MANPILSTSRGGGPNALISVVCVAWILVAAFVVGREPLLGLGVGVAPIVAYLLIRSATVRVLAVTVGGMILLGSSTDLGPNKIIYAAVVVVCALISGYRLISNPPLYAWVFRPLVWFGLAVVAIFGISYLASPAGSDLPTFGRQSIFYLLIVLGPVIGLDSGRDLAPRTVHAIIGIIGIVAAVGFAADWLTRRGVTALPFGRFVLSSLVLPGLAFGLALVTVFHARSVIARILWLIPIIAIPIAMLVTGTRTNLIIFIAILFVLGSMRKARVPLGRMIALVIVAGVAGLVLFPIAVSVAVADPDFIANRVAALISALSGNGDASQSFRQDQAEIAAEMISYSPFFGFGLGYAVPFTVDSPLLTPLRLGWVGTGLVASFIGALSVAVWRGARAYSRSPATTAWWAFLAICLVNLIFGTPLEDRGFGFAIMLVTMAIASGFNASSIADTSTPRNRTELASD